MSSNTYKLPAFLQSEGYYAIPFIRKEIRHLLIEALVGDQLLYLMVDTGASHSCIHQGKSYALQLQAVDLQLTPKGLLNLQQDRITTVAMQQLKLGTFEIRNSSWVVLDLSQVNQAMKGTTVVDGIMGADLLQQHAAIIDYAGGMLFLKES